VNRTRFRAMVAASLDRRSLALKVLGRCAEPSGGHCGISVLYIDLDGFKPVNDTLGHAAGDQVLVEVAERLRSATRGTDTIARLGGDEFAILLERTSGAEADARTVAERVLAGIKRQIVLDGIPVTVGASVGIACISGDGTACSPDQLLREADLAMYAAKAKGRDCYELATVHG
jgi:diguanylate cyclase (GGDEF)-like protein